jgi:indoleamine 2,3-dioxygenase
LDSGSDSILEAYNMAICALKAFRDAHIRIVTIYIMGPARRSKTQKGGADGQDGGMKGTGGTDLTMFLKGVRDLTADTVLSAERN